MKEKIFRERKIQRLISITLVFAMIFTTMITENAFAEIGKNNVANLKEAVEKVTVNLYMGETSSAGTALSNSGIVHVSSCINPTFGAAANSSIVKGNNGNLVGLASGSTTIPATVSTTSCSEWGTCSHSVNIKVNVNPAVAFDMNQGAIGDVQTNSTSFTGTIPNPSWTKDGITVTGFSTNSDGTGTYYPVGSTYNFSSDSSTGIRLYAQYKKNPTASDFTYSASSDLTYSGTEKVATVEYGTGKNQLQMGDKTVYYTGTTRTTNEAYGPSTTPPTKAGTYKVYVETAGGTRYFATADNSSNPVLSDGKKVIELGEFTIQPKELSITDPVDTVSDATEINSHSTYMKVDGVNSEKITVKYVYNDSDNNEKKADVDTPNVTELKWNATIPVAADNNNYVLVPQTGSNGHVVYHVDGQDTNNEYQKEPSITVVDTKEYGESFTVGSNVSFGPEYGRYIDTKWTVIVKKDGVIEYSDTVLAENGNFTVPGTIPVGTYTVEVSYVKNFKGSEGENLVARGIASKTVEITKRPLTVKEGVVVVDKNYDQSKVVYQDAVIPSKTLQFDKDTLNNVVNSDNVTFTAEGTYDSSEVGNRAISLTNITLDEESAKNYTLADTASGSGTINKAPSTVTTAEYGYIYINDTKENHGLNHPSIADIAKVVAKAKKLNEDTMTLEDADIDVELSYVLENTVYKPNGLAIDEHGNITSAATVTTNQNVDYKDELWPLVTVTCTNEKYVINNSGNSTVSVTIPFAVLGKGEYGITLVLNNDGASIPDSWTGKYLKRDGKTLPTAEKTGYTFVGWYDNAELSGSTITEISAGSEGAKTFYGKWYKNVNNSDITVEASESIYSGLPFNVVVKDGTTVLTEDIDYSVSYETDTVDCTVTVTATITGLETKSTTSGVYSNGYTGEKTKTFTYQDVKVDSSELTESGLTLKLKDTLDDSVAFTEGECSIKVNDVNLNPSEYIVTTDGTNKKVVITFNDKIKPGDKVKISVDKIGVLFNNGASIEKTLAISLPSGGESKPPISTGGESKPSTSTEDYNVSVKNENAIDVNAQIKDGTANVSDITDETINKVIDTNGESKVDTIKFDLSEAKQDVTGVTLSKKTVETLAKVTAKEDNHVESVTVDLSKASVVLDTKTLDTLHKEAKGNEITLVVEDKEQKKLNNNQKDTVKDYHVATTFEAYFESAGSKIHDFRGGTVTLSIKFTPEPGKDVNFYHVVYLKDKGGMERYKTKYKDGYLIFTTTHFSDYAAIYDDGEKNDTDSEKTVAVKGIDVKANKTTLTKKGDTATIKVTVNPTDATNKKVTYTSSDKKVVTVDSKGKVTAVANGKATVTVKTEDGAFTKKITFTVKIPATKPSKKELETNGNALISNATATWTKDEHLKLTWGKVKGAAGYEVFVNKCDGKSIWNKKAYEAKKGTTSTVTLKKLSGKKFDTKANYKYAVRAYKLVNGKKVYIGESFTYHFTGSKNNKYTNPKSVSVKNKKVLLKVKKSTKISAKVIQANPKAIVLEHELLLRYISTNPSVAKVDMKSGKVTGVKKGTCKIYCVALNGVKTTVDVTVK